MRNEYIVHNSLLQAIVRVFYRVVAGRMNTLITAVIGALLYGSNTLCLLCNSRDCL